MQKPEIERKFLVRYLPDLSQYSKISYERYFLFCENNIELRVQKKGEKYKFERKIKHDNFVAEKYKFEITKEEFEYFIETSIGKIHRDSYEITKNTSLKIYHGEQKGFMRIEVEFENREEADDFKIPEWFGKEISGKRLARDSELIKISQKELTNIQIDI